MSVERFKNLVDRSFLESWLGIIGNRLDESPTTKEGCANASFICQLAVMTILQQRNQLPTDRQGREDAADFGMELVARLWPLFPVGFKSDLGEELWGRLQFVGWDTESSVQHNIRAPKERELTLALLRDRLKEFPSLSESDRSAILPQTPSVRAWSSLLSEREREIVAGIPFELLMRFQQRVLKQQLEGEIRVKLRDKSAVELFAGIPGDVFEPIRRNTGQTLDLILAYRSRFDRPPQSPHRDAVESILGEGDMSQSLAPIQSLSGGADRGELLDCFWKLTFVASYEASHNLLLSENFLNKSSQRDVQNRNKSGFHFWHDLQTPPAKEISALCLEGLGRFIVEILPHWSDEQRAALLGISPLCLFLEAIRLGELPEADVEVVRNAEIKCPAKPPPPTESASAVPTPAAPGSTSSTTYQRERTIRVFVSSTFRDMHEEREELVKRVFPELRKLCEERGVSFAEIDLRWGITEEQAEHGGVLPICLREIERCRPFFIGLLGERYGWVPKQIPDELVERHDWLTPYKGRSVTEMEILYGVLDNPAMANRACFYLRDPDYVENILPEKRSDFVESDTDLRNKLHQLKDKIRRSGLAVKENYRDPQDLGRMVLEDLTTALNQEFPPQSEPDPFQRMSEEHEAFARSRRGVYIGRQDYYRRLDKHVEENGPPLIILGDSGCGKSALLANWAIDYRRQHPETLVLMHFVGAGAESTGWEVILRRVMAELKRYTGMEENIPQDSKELRNAFPLWLKTASARLTAPGAKIILILDGLNQLEDREGAVDLVWLPEELPERIVFLLSTLPGRPLEELNRRQLPSMTVEPLKLPERRQLIVDYLAQYAKQLSPSRMERIAAAPQAANPLYVRALLDELRLFGIHEQLDQRIDHYLEAETIDDLFERILARCEEDYDRDRPHLVRDTMSLLWASRRGLSEAEILDMLGSGDDSLPRALWSPLFLSLESSLVIRSGLINFFHDYLRKAVGDRYLPEDWQRRAVHKQIADYFDARDADPRQLDELPWQLCRAADWDRLTDRLKALSFLCAAHHHDAYSLMTYWKDIEDNSSYRMEQTYAELVDSPEKDPHAAHVLAHLMTETGRLEIAARLFAADIDRYRSSGDQLNTAIALQNAGSVLGRLGRMEQGLSFLREAEVIWREAGYIRGLQGTLGNIADTLRELGRLDEARILLVEQARLARELDDRPILASNLNNQALICKDQGDFDGAIELFRQCELVCRELGDQQALQLTFGNLASLYLTRNDDEAALELLKKQEQICRESASRLGLMSSLCNQAIIMRRKGDLDASWQILQEHEQLCWETAYQRGLIHNLGNKAHILRIRRQFDDAFEMYREAEQIGRHIGDLKAVAIALSNQADLLEDRMDLQSALALRKKQEEICRKLSNPYELAQCLTKKSELLGIPMGQPKDAMPMIKEAEGLARQLGIESLTREVDSVKRQLQLASLF